MLSYIGLLQSHAVKLTGNCQMKIYLNPNLIMYTLTIKLKGQNKQDSQ
jgi:hypothetical protein